MPKYNCLDCQREIPEDISKKRIRCPFCGSKIIYKPRINASTIEAI